LDIGEETEFDEVIAYGKNDLRVNDDRDNFIFISQKVSILL